MSFQHKPFAAYPPPCACHCIKQIGITFSLVFLNLHQEVLRCHWRENQSTSEGKRSSIKKGPTAPRYNRLISFVITLSIKAAWSKMPHNHSVSSLACHIVVVDWRPPRFCHISVSGGFFSLHPPVIKDHHNGQQTV